ncbi:MAG TPA: hypothetical protein GXX19_00835 [Syntrophomonadaceae bacterium]|nr:hypothetical protein [Syntrophomonadaceae bacterium]
MKAIKLYREMAKAAIVLRQRKSPAQELGLSHHLTGRETIDLKNFNLYLALLVALQYISRYDKYPFDRDNREMYNRLIETGRRRLGSD